MSIRAATACGSISAFFLFAPSVFEEPEQRPKYSFSTQVTYALDTYYVILDTPLRH